MGISLRNGFEVRLVPGDIENVFHVWVRVRDDDRDPPFPGKDLIFGLIFYIRDDRALDCLGGIRAIQGHAPT